MVRSYELFRQGQDQGHGQLSHGDAAPQRHDGDVDPGTLCRGQVDAILPPAVLLNELECGRRRDQRGVDRARLGEERIGVAQQRDQLLTIWATGRHDAEALLRQ